MAVFIPKRTLKFLPSASSSCFLRSFLLRFSGALPIMSLIRVIPFPTEFCICCPFASCCCASSLHSVFGHFFHLLPRKLRLRVFAVPAVNAGKMSNKNQGPGCHFFLTILGPISKMSASTPTGFVYPHVLVMETCIIAMRVFEKLCSSHCCDCLILGSLVFREQQIYMLLF